MRQNAKEDWNRGGNEGEKNDAQDVQNSSSKVEGNNDYDAEELVRTANTVLSEPSVLEEAVKRSDCDRNRPVQYNSSKEGGKYLSTGQNYMTIVEDLNQPELEANAEVSTQHLKC